MVVVVLVVRDLEQEQEFLEQQVIFPPSFPKVVAVAVALVPKMEEMVVLVVVERALQLGMSTDWEIKGTELINQPQHQFQHKDILVVQDILDHMVLMDILLVAVAVQVVLVQQEMVQRLLDLEEMVRHLPSPDLP